MKRITLAVSFVLALPCVAWSGEAQQVTPVKIGVASFSHETCTFCPRPTGIAEWEFYGPPVRGEAVRLGLAELLVVTSNDDLPALALYQRYGFRIREVIPGRIAQEHSGELPGFFGIPVRDEIQMTYELAG